MQFTGGLRAFRCHALHGCCPDQKPFFDASEETTRKHLYPHVLASNILGRWAHVPCDACLAWTQLMHGTFGGNAAAAAAAAGCVVLQVWRVQVAWIERRGLHVRTLHCALHTLPARLLFLRMGLPRETRCLTWWWCRCCCIRACSRQQLLHARCSLSNDSAACRLWQNCAWWHLTA
jgi:hypothetical protein